jgi:hypothetical protein
VTGTLLCDPAIFDPAIFDAIRQSPTLDNILTQLEKTPRTSMWEPGYWEPGSMNEFSPARKILENTEK